MFGYEQKLQQLRKNFAKKFRAKSFKQNLLSYESIYRPYKNCPLSVNRWIYEVTILEWPNCVDYIMREGGKWGEKKGSIQ